MMRMCSRVKLNCFVQVFLKTRHSFYLGLYWSRCSHIHQQYMFHWNCCFNIVEETHHYQEKARIIELVKSSHISDGRNGVDLDTGCLSSGKKRVTAAGLYLYNSSCFARSFPVSCPNCISKICS